MSPGPKTWPERLLAPIADVRRDEVASVLLMTLIMFLILAAYYMIKTAREVFILGEGGAEVKSYSSAGQAILLLFLVPAYGAFASRVNRMQLVQWTTVFFISHLGLFLIALGAGLHIGIPYFLWVGIFNLMVIAQFWAFAADLYTHGAGQTALPAHRRRQQPRRVGRIGPCRPDHGGDRPPAPACRGGGRTDGVRLSGAPRQSRHAPVGRPARRKRPATSRSDAREGSRLSAPTGT